jgi:peroxiredoxin
MSKRQKEILAWLLLLVCVIILVTILVLAVVKKESAEPILTEYPNQHSQSESVSEGSVQPKVSLDDVVKKARTWKPVYTVWYGETAQDFALTDITGKEHRLSDYRGKDLVIIFWATWCGPCVQEVPQLISLRSSVSEDKLAMLAISTEPPRLVKKFAEERNINYPVFAADITTLPDPFSRIMYIPSSFFIGPQGKIKIAVSGAISVREIKAILEAE